MGKEACEPEEYGDGVSAAWPTVRKYKPWKSLFRESGICRNFPPVALAWGGVEF